MSLVFYDTETTGTEAAFDQILQFAAILTNADLEEIDRFEIRCRLLPHVVPSPAAMRVTKKPCSELDHSELPSHYGMVCAIHAKLTNWSPATFIGYNTLGFDEHLLRQAFYQTLHPPYLTSMPGSARCDVMRIVQAASVFAPGTFKFRLDEEGRQIFKLDAVAPENGFLHANAHDALADVEATIHLARLVRERAPELWSNAMRFSTKSGAADFINNEPVFCAGNFYFGKSFSWALTAIGPSPKNAADVCAFDLSIDPRELASLSDEELVARLAAYPRPVRTVKTNAAPYLLPLYEGHALTTASELSEEEIEARAAFIEADAAFRSRLITAFIASRGERAKSPHVEQQLYDDFVSDADWDLAGQFHKAPWENRSEILNKITDRRLRLLGRRLLFVERPDLLDPDARQEYGRRLAERILGRQGDVPWLTLPKALTDLEALLADAHEQEATLLLEHREWLQARVQTAMSAAA